MFGVYLGPSWYYNLKEKWNATEITKNFVYYQTVKSVSNDRLLLMKSQRL
jgi:hypothetical protein